jgi:hypothetical protein
MADKRKIDKKTQQAVRKKDGEIWQTEKREQRDMADKRKIDRKTWLAVRRKDGEIWQKESVCLILMFITAFVIYIESENNCRLHILLYYELKFNRNNLFQLKYIFSIKSLRHK